MHQDGSESTQESLDSLDTQLDKIDEERAGMLYRIITSRFVDKVGNAIPGLNLFKQIPEIALGETTSGRKLSRDKDKYIHAIEMVAVNIAWGILIGEYKGEIDPHLLGAVPALKAISNINNTKEGLILTKETILSIFGAIKYMATDKEFMESLIASIGALSVDVFSHQVVNLDIKNA